MRTGQVDGRAYPDWCGAVVRARHGRDSTDELYTLCLRRFTELRTRVRSAGGSRSHGRVIVMHVVMITVLVFLSCSGDPDPEAVPRCRCTRDAGSCGEGLRHLR